MIRALYTAASGMTAQQQNIDNVAHNLANVNTTGFKKSRVEFEDLVYDQTRVRGAPTSTTAEAPSFRLRVASSSARWSSGPAIRFCTPSVSRPASASARLARRATSVAAI